MKNKLIYSILLTLILTFLIILTLTIIRNKTSSYIQEIQLYQPELKNIQNNLLEENIPQNDLQEAGQTINYVDSIAKKALKLNKIYLPLILMLLITLHQIIYWKLNKNTSIKYIIPLTIINLIILAFLILQIINYADYKVFLQGKNNLVITVLLAILLLITYCLSLIILTRNKLVFIIKNLKRLILPFLLLSITNSVYIILIGAIFVLSYINYSILIPSILIIIFIILTEFQKHYLVRKISSLKD